MKSNEGTKGGASATVTGRIAPAMAAVSLVAALASATASAQQNGNGTVELWLSDAPLDRVLEQIAGKDGVRVVVGDGVDRRISGRLDGLRETVLATLAVEHGLSVHAAGDTVWFDSKSRPVVSLLRLPAEETARARAALEPILEEDSVVQDTEEGLVLSGSRAFVEDARRRVAALAASLPAAAAATPLVVDSAAAASAADVPGAAPESAISSGQEIRSVWDIPGYDVDYTVESDS